MSRRGPIIVVEDDYDDQKIIQDAIRASGQGNEILLFETAPAALQYLMETNQQPFLILSDVSLPQIDGIEFRRQILANEYLREKSIPFIFMSTTDSQEVVNEAYSLVVQGFFIKTNSYQQIVDNVKLICLYWKTCRHPYNEY